MARTLKVTKTEKIKDLIGRGGGDLEASGVVAEGNDFYLVLDEFPMIGRFHDSLEKKDSNKWVYATSGKDGFEGMTRDAKRDLFYVVVEKGEVIKLEKKNGELKKRGGKKDLDFTCDKDKPNKGYEGLSHVEWRSERYLLGMCEGDQGKIQMFRRKNSGDWEHLENRTLTLPKKFDDHSGLAVRDDPDKQEVKIAVLSQEESKLWVGKLRKRRNRDWRFVGDGTVYKFPKSNKNNTIYCNVEGVDWLDNDRLVVVSDSKKSDQNGRCKKRHRSIHIVELT